MTSMDFDSGRWDALKTTMRGWWAGSLKRPIIAAPLWGRATSRAQPSIPWHHFNSFYDFSVPAEAIVDWYEYHVENTVFLGDSFPSALPYFGPGSIAAHLGAKVRNTETTTWFQPRQAVEAKDLRLKLIPDEPWLKRVLDIYRAAQDRFEGNVLLATTDIGGNLDVVSSFRHGEALLFDLYDCPEEIERLAWEAHEAWWQCFDMIRAVSDKNPGYSSWTPMFSETPFYMLQCDFCYMIGPAQFEKFVLPGLRASCARLSNAFYHLDGPGQLPHLDYLLDIPELKGIQWVPGEGQPDITQWPEVYRKIRKAGKLVQFFAGQSKYGLETIDVIADQLGSAEGLMMLGGGSVQNDEAKTLRLLSKYGCI